MALGEKLCNARLARKESTSAVAAATRMKVQVVEAIEREDFRRIAAPIYAKGFIRLYAVHVGLDPQPLLEEYTARFASAADRPPPLVDGRPRVKKILQTAAEMPGRVNAAGGAGDADAPPDLFDFAPAAPDRGAPPLRPFDPQAAAAPRGGTAGRYGRLAAAAAGVATGALRLAHCCGKALTALRPAQLANVLPSAHARLAAVVVAIATVVFIVSAVSHCGGPAAPRSGAPPPPAAATSADLAVEPAAPYFD